MSIGTKLNTPEVVHRQPCGLCCLLPDAQGSYSEREAAGIIRALLEVVAYTHDMGCVHRDIKVGETHVRLSIPGKRVCASVRTCLCLHAHMFEGVWTCLWSCLCCVLLSAQACVLCACVYVCVSLQEALLNTPRPAPLPHP